MKKIAAQMARIIAIVGISTYLGDYTIFRYRVAAGRSPYGTVTVQFYYAIHQKNRKTEYDFQPRNRRFVSMRPSLTPDIGHAGTKGSTPRRPSEFDGNEPSAGKCAGSFQMRNLYATCS
jgi:hypothetical protein